MSHAREDPSQKVKRGEDGRHLMTRKCALDQKKTKTTQIATKRKEKICACVRMPRMAGFDQELFC